MDVTRPMGGVVVRASGASLALRVAAGRLRALGAAIEDGGPAPADAPAGHLAVVRAPLDALPECGIGWSGPVGVPMASERDVQAACGIMHVHGRATGGPRALGIDYASVCAGVLAAQAVTAGTLAALHGRTDVAATTSVAQAAALALTQYIAVATAAPSVDLRRVAPIRPPIRATRRKSTCSDERTPPFRSSDGVPFEIEIFEAERWSGFWGALGTERAAIVRGWPPFQQRFATATCALPPELGAAAASHEYRAVRAAAEAVGVSVLPVRDTTAPPLPAPASPWRLGPLTGETAAAPPPDARGRSSGVRDAAPSSSTPVSSGRYRPLAGEVAAAASPDARDRSSGVCDAAPASSPPPGGRGPLAGVRVVESTNRVQGPLAGHVLGLLGADVVRLEPPGGDPLRGVPPMAGECSARFLALNRGKEAVEADLRSAAGRETALRLAASADVFLRNWPPGRAARFRLTAADLADVRPSLVHAQAGGWAEAMPAPQPMGTDYLVQAHSGVAALVAGPGRPPAPTLMTIIDVLGALISAEGVVAGLLARARTGAGVRVETALIDAGRLLREVSPAGRVPREVVHSPVDESPRAPVVSDLAAMAADPAYAALFETDGAASYSRAPWIFDRTRELT